MIRVLVVDDHPALRTGLMTLLRSEPGIVPVGAASSATQGLSEAKRHEPTVALLDYGLPDYDGLQLCCDLKALPNPPLVVIYTAFARPRLGPVAAAAGVDAILDKGVLPDELFDTLRRVVGGIAEAPGASPEVFERCIAELSPEDLPLFGMAVNGAPMDEIAAVAGRDIPTMRARLRGLVAQLLDGERAAPVDR